MEVSVADLQRDLAGCLMMYKNKPVKVTLIDGKGNVYYTELLTQKTGETPFTLKDFTAPPRVGFVNLFGGAFFVQRIPVRKYYFGLHKQNVGIKMLPTGYMPGMDQRKLNTLDCVEIGRAMMGKYPTLLEALTESKTTGGCCAFDKQFAVDSQQHVFFKDRIVGKVGRYVNKPKIVWEKGMEYLDNLLDGNYEKDIRATWTKAS